MEKYIYTATQDIDALLYVVDCNIKDEELEAEKEALLKEAGFEDNCLDTAELFGLWVIEGNFEEFYHNELSPLLEKEMKRRLEVLEEM